MGARGSKVLPMGPRVLLQMGPGPLALPIGPGPLALPMGPGPLVSRLTPLTSTALLMHATVNHYCVSVHLNEFDSNFYIP